MAKKVEFNMETAKKYTFWICAPLGLVVAVLTGLMAIGDVGGKLETRRKQLDDQKKSVETLRSGATNHPNQGTINEIVGEDGSGGLLKEQVDKIMAAWQTLEKDQREQNRWDGLADRAIDDIKRKNFLDPLQPTTLTNYLNFARIEFDKLHDKSNIQRVQQYQILGGGREEPVEKGGGLIFSSNDGFGSPRSARSSGFSRDSSGGAAVSGAMRLKGKVVWGSPDIKITMKDWEQQPQSFEVWLTQEDLWVYQALLWVVAKSNQDAKEASKIVSTGSVTGGATGIPGTSRPLDLSSSVVKEIVELSIGQNAAKALADQSSRRVGSGFGGGEGMEMSGTFGAGGGGEFGDGMSGGTEAARSAALNGRYVDDAGNPLTDIDLSGQFRRMPIYLQFVVDQRRISDVLVNCANCPMPIDVLWVTINPDATDSFDFASNTGMGGESYGGSSGSRSPGRQMSGSRSSFGSDGAPGGIVGLDRSSGGGPAEIDYGPDAVTIEIYGCINIFTPPDAAKITGGSGSE